MPPRRARRFAAALGVGLALAALSTGAGGQDAPKSILPEDVFGPPPAQPVAPPAAVPGTNPEAAPTPSGEPAASAPEPAPGQPGPALTAANPLDTDAPAVDIGLTGLLAPAAGGYGPGVFTGSDGPVLAGLMRAMHAPIASRWAHILLVRALASIVPTPDRVRPADWVAERASLLMRLGESDVAHALAQRVPTDRFTPRLYGVAFDAALAAADPVAFCPLTQTGQVLFKRPVWRLGGAICAAFDGDDITAARGFEALRTDPAIDPFDISLAERLAQSAGEGAKLGANVDWGETETVNLYRIGLGLAAGTAIPDRLIAKLPPPAQGWVFRAASATDAARTAAAGPAGAQGIAGSGELVAFYAALAAAPESAGVGGDTPGRLRQAWAGSPADRMAAMRALWDAAQGPDRYGALVLTAGAAATLRPDARFAKYAPDIMASALAGGRADAALRWLPIAEREGGETARRAWALAVVADPNGAVEASTGRFADWRKLDGDAGRQRARMLLAALDGLGRGSAGCDSFHRDLGVTPINDRWAARIDAAAAAGRAGEVLVLAGTGLQTDWANVPPAHLTHILAALVRVGRATEARLIAAEAITRA